jgi:WD40 repeat protein
MSSPTQAYVAFISYRHEGPDRAWAKWLHRALEGYRLPRSVSREFDVPRRLGTVFRDEEELPAASELKREVELALERSKYLIVVCSPRTPGSQWVNQEVTRFLEFGRGDRILTLLTDGDPAVSFPLALRGDQRGHHAAVPPQRPRGLEPLAADVRPDTEESPARRKRRAKFKIAAAILGVPFDVLYRRERERRTRRLAVAITSLVLTSAVLAGLALFAWLQRNLAEERRVLAEARLAESLVREGDAYVLSGQLGRARPLFDEALAKLQELSLPVLPAEIARWQADQVAGAPTFAFQGPRGGVTSLAISPDGQSALAGGDGEVQVLDLVGWTEMATLRGHEGFVDDVAFGPPGSKLAATAGADGTVRVWDLSSGRTQLIFRKHGVGVKAATFSPDGRYVASAGADGVVRFWDASTGSERRVFESHEGTVWDVAFLPDGQHLVSAGNDGRILLWDTRRKALVREFIGHVGPVEALDVAEDGRTLISGGNDGTVRAWDIESGDHITVVENREELIFDVAFSPAGRFAITADSSGTVQLLDTETPGKPVRKFSGHNDVACCVAYSADLTTVVSGGGDGKVLVWDMALETGHIVIEAHGEGRAVALSPDGWLLASGGKDGKVRIWDTADGTPLQVFEAGDRPVSTLAFSAAGEEVIVGDEDGSLNLWRLRENSESRHLYAHTRLISDVATAPDGRRIVSAGLDGVIRLWDSNIEKEIWSVEAHHGGVTSLAFSPDGHGLVSGGRDGVVRTWDASSGRPAASLSGHTGWVISAAYSVDGSHVVSSDANGFVRVWQLSTGEARYVLGDGLRSENAVGISPEGRYAFSGGLNLAVTIWDLDLGSRLRTLTINDYINDLAISRNGQTLALATSIGVELLDFGRVARHRALHGRLEAARRRLHDDPKDPQAAMVLGEWYAHSSISQAAIEELEFAATSGTQVSSLLLARAYRRLGHADRALIHFRNAQKRGEASDLYLTLCARVLERANVGESEKIP